jgi:Na+/melibiose symporter-like transporter
MLILGLVGFVAGENAVQPEEAIHGIWLTFSLLPGIGSGIAAVALLLYKLRDKDVQVMAKYNRGEISKEAAEESLSGKYGSAAELAHMEVVHD